MLLQLEAIAVLVTKRTAAVWLTGIAVAMFA